MTRISRFLFKSKIKYLLRWLGPESHSLSGPDAQKNNYITIRVKIDEESEFVVLSLEKDTLSGMIYLKRGQGSDHSFSLADLYDKNISIQHQYKGWSIHHPSITKATLLVFFKYHLINHYLQILYNLKRNPYRDRFKILKRIMSLSEYDPKHQVNNFVLLENFYGPRIMNSNKMISRTNHLNMIIDSLKLSEDLIVEDDGFLSRKINITPKAVTTLAQFKLEQRRHYMLAGIFLLQFIVAAVIAWISWFKPSIE